MKILLMGNPNVGKSVVFSRLTGVRVVTSNYPGSTVEFTKGSMQLEGKKVDIIDVPGTYTLEPTSKAEEVAARMLEDGDVVIDVVDATNLERNLSLTLELLERHVPLVVALNMWDETKHKGIKVDVAKLEELLRVPVVPTVALTGVGIKELVDRIPEAASPPTQSLSYDERWALVGRIIEQVQVISRHHHTWLERLGDASIKPLPGLLIAALILLLSFMGIRFIGEGLIGYIFEPLFEGLWAPVMMKLSNALGSGGLLHDVLIGELINGEIDFTQSFGMLTTGLFIIFGAVLPYVFSFYLVLGFLEDLGYLPRLAVLLDNLLHRIGLHGYAIIPTLLGLGCNVPAIMATRILESKRERFIVATLISIGIPCAALQAMIFGLVGDYGIQYVIMVYGTLFVVWIVLGIILNSTIKGFSPELLIEIPPYRLPPLQTLASKIWMRIYGFLREAVPVVLIGILVITLLYALGVFDRIASFAAPVVSGLFGLPDEAVSALVVGFLRKDMAMGMLGTLDLSAGQAVVGSVVLAMFFPCIASFVVLARELGFRDMLKATGIMIIASLVVGGLLNLAF
ncbi:MAG: ferrous iron transporter B [Chloroflexota bacterium]|nr:ferrous iron transporter B [Chloroflexota bacterium]